MILKLNLNKKKSLIENGRYSYPLIIDDLFNDITIKENLKKIYSINKILPRSGIFHIKQNYNKYFYQYQTKNIYHDLFNYKNLSTENVFLLFSKV